MKGADAQAHGNRIMSSQNLEVTKVQIHGLLRSHASNILQYSKLKTKARYHLGRDEIEQCLGTLGTFTALQVRRLIT